MDQSSLLGDMQMAFHERSVESDAHRKLCGVVHIVFREWPAGSQHQFPRVLRSLGY